MDCGQYHKNQECDVQNSSATIHNRDRHTTQHTQHSVHKHTNIRTPTHPPTHLPAHPHPSHNTPHNTPPHNIHPHTRLTLSFITIESCMPESTLVPSDELSTFSGTRSPDTWPTFAASKHVEISSWCLSADKMAGAPSSSPLSDADRSLGSLLGSWTMASGREACSAGTLETVGCMM